MTTEKQYDVLIVGGGIYGATLACRAARAGLKVVLIDKGDFGSEASANSLKILHGGLRYLQQMDIVRMRESIRSRRDGLIALPHLARPAPFLAPTGSTLKRSRLAYAIAAGLNDAVSADRNRHVQPSHHLPRTSVWSKKKLDAELPGSEINASGAIAWSDGLIENTERYTLAYIMSAKEAGATIMNYVRAHSLIQSRNRIEGVLARNEEQQEFELRAEMTVNATGGWLSDLLPPGCIPAEIQPRVKAYNIVVNRSWFGQYGVGLNSQDRNFFFAPWRGGTMIGTEYCVFDGNADACRLTREEIESFITHVNDVYPSAGLSYRDVTFAHVGILPAMTGKDGQPFPLPSGKTLILNFKRTHGIDGLLAIRGVKYTTASHWASVLINIILEHLGRRSPKSSERPLYGAERMTDAGTILREAGAAGWILRRESADWLARHYGSRYDELIEMATRESALGELIPDTVAPKAVVSHAIICEGAKHLDDIVFRRTDIGSFKHPGMNALNAMADQMAAIHKWDATMRETELKRVASHYERLGVRCE